MATGHAIAGHSSGSIENGSKYGTITGFHGADHGSISSNYCRLAQSYECLIPEETSNQEEDSEEDDEETEEEDVGLQAKNSNNSIHSNNRLSLTNNPTACLLTTAMSCYSDTNKANQLAYSTGSDYLPYSLEGHSYLGGSGVSSSYAPNHRSPCYSSTFNGYFDDDVNGTASTNISSNMVESETFYHERRRYFLPLPSNSSNSTSSSNSMCSDTNTNTSTNNNTNSNGLETGTTTSSLTPTTGSTTTSNWFSEANHLPTDMISSSGSLPMVPSSGTHGHHTTVMQSSIINQSNHYHHHYHHYHYYCPNHLSAPSLHGNQAYHAHHHPFMSSSASHHLHHLHGTTGQSAVGSATSGTTSLTSAAQLFGANGNNNYVRYGYDEELSMTSSSTNLSLPESPIKAFGSGKNTTTNSINHTETKRKLLTESSSNGKHLTDISTNTANSNVNCSISMSIPQFEHSINKGKLVLCKTDGADL